LEPITVPLALDDLDEIRERWIEIKRLPDRSLVTVIEILSPTNKTGSGRIDYIEKRKQWIRQPVNVVEIDLLLGGHYFLIDLVDLLRSRNTKLRDLPSRDTSSVPPSWNTNQFSTETRIINGMLSSWTPGAGR